VTFTHPGGENWFDSLGFGRIWFYRGEAEKNRNGHEKAQNAQKGKGFLATA
jgi:hypothetical protein